MIHKIRAKTDDVMIDTATSAGNGSCGVDVVAFAMLISVVTSAPMVPTLTARPSAMYGPSAICRAPVAATVQRKQERHAIRAWVGKKATLATTHEVYKHSQRQPISVA